MEKKENLERVTICLPQKTCESIKLLASKKHLSFSNVVRSFIEEGLSVNAYSEHLETIRQMIHDEMQIVAKNEIERVIKMQAKSTMASGISMFTVLALLAEQFSDEASMERLLANASKQAHKYMKQKEKTDIEYLSDAKVINNMISEVVNVDDN